MLAYNVNQNHHCGIGNCNESLFIAADVYIHITRKYKYWRKRKNGGKARKNIDANKRQEMLSFTKNKSTKERADEKAKQAAISEAFRRRHEKEKQMNQLKLPS